MVNTIPLTAEGSLSEKDILRLREQNITNLEQFAAFLEIGSSRVALSILLDKTLKEVSELQAHIQEILKSHGLPRQQTNHKNRKFPLGYKVEKASKFSTL
jgi:hypothetical protein